MEKVLITGGAGFIGSNLALKLLAKGYEVTVVDNLSTQIHGVNPDNDSPLYNSIKGKVNFIYGNISDKSLMEKILLNQNYIYHLAAETGTGQSMYQIQHYFKVNVDATSLMMDILANNNHQVKKILISSSRAIYGEGKYLDRNREVIYPGSRLDKDLVAGKFDPLCVKSGDPLTLVATDELSKMNAISVYGLTKYYQEDMLMRICPTIGITTTAVRYQNVYGPGQSLSNPYTGILAVFSTRILNGNPIEIFEDGLESRDFVYIDDVVEATILAMENSLADNQVFNVGYGRATSVKYIAEKLLSLYGKKVDIKISGKYRVGDIRHNYADITKIQKLLNFSPKVDFDYGIAKFAQWVLTQEIQKDNYDNSVAELKAKGLFKGRP